MSLYDDARQHQLREWGARTLGLRYTGRLSDDIFTAATPEGGEHLIRIDYVREEVRDLNSGRHVVICRPLTK